MNWSESTWQIAKPIYDKILELPFLKSLADGTLEIEKFQFYIKQDSIYLEHFGRVLAMIGAKSNHINHALAYIRFAENAIVVENALHESFFADYSIKEKGNIRPICHHYVHYLKSLAGFEAVEITTAATLPCFWIYMKVGQHIIQHAKLENNPYTKWISTYASEDFEKDVNQALAICNSLAEETTEEIRNKMTEAFLLAAHFEHEFWRAADENIIWTTY
ncbi:MAG: thiaminase II [Chryseobacterium sp.]|nr:thiaminase II [Candidatus Chryseobacterium enterohippi]